MEHNSFPDPDSPDALVLQSQQGTIAALIEQMEHNWRRDDHAANDDVVLRIRELIRQQKADRQPD